MKKIIALLIMAAVAASCFVGCGDNSTGSGEKMCIRDRQYDDQHREDDGIGQLGRNISFAEDLDDPQQDSANHRARDRADTAEDCRGKSLDAGHRAGGRKQHRVGRTEQHASDRRQRRTNRKGDGDGTVSYTHLDVYKRQVNPGEYLLYNPAGNYQL